MSWSSLEVLLLASDVVKTNRSKIMACESETVCGRWIEFEVCEDLYLLIQEWVKVEMCNWSVTDQAYKLELIVSRKLLPFSVPYTSDGLRTACGCEAEMKGMRCMHADRYLILTVSLISPSFMRRFSLAASRFLSRLGSSIKDTNPLRSNFSTY